MLSYHVYSVRISNFLTKIFMKFGIDFCKIITRMSWIFTYTHVVISAPIMLTTWVVNLERQPICHQRKDNIRVSWVSIRVPRQVEMLLADDRLRHSSRVLRGNIYELICILVMHWNQCFSLDFTCCWNKSYDWLDSIFMYALWGHSW